MNGKQYHQAHRETVKSPWRVAFEGAVIVVLFVAVVIAMSVRG